MPPRSCLVRRKGSGSWANHGNFNLRPSLKIKNFNDDTEHEFARYSCATTRRCNSLPAGSLRSAENNVWKSTKVTLNGQLQGTGEIDGFKLYSDAGLIAPLAEQATVRLFRDTELRVGPVPYAMVETVNDRAFVEKHFGDDFVLWEVESLWWLSWNSQPPIPTAHVSLRKRDGGAFQGALQIGNDTATFTGMSETGFNMSYFQRYLAVEQLANNYDSACGANSNYYVVATPRENRSALFTWIPHGIDRAFMCPQHGGQLPPVDGGSCPVAACLQRESCAAEFCAVFEDLAALAHRLPDPPCQVHSVCLH